VPEYLAPAVYVEETSFRSKSIEGVSTSTTGFVGPTLTGPHKETPELLTSFADFERIYGGLDNLEFANTMGSTTSTLNYLAHAVRAYFNEGGGRLFVARVMPVGAKAASVTIIENEAQFIARFNGRLGDGTITVKPVKTKATPKSLETAPAGTVFLGSAQPATLMGGAMAPFDLSTAPALDFTLGTLTTDEPVSIKLVDTGPVEVTLSGLTEPVGATTLELVLNGTKLPGIELEAFSPADPDKLETVVNTINSYLYGGYARLEGGALIIGAQKSLASDRVSVVVKRNAQLKNGTVGAANVGDLKAVTQEELDLALRGSGVRAVTSGGKVALQTTLTGEKAKATWTGSKDLLAFGATPATSSGGAQLYLKSSTGWTDENGGTTPPSGSPLGEFVTLTITTKDGAGRETTYEGVGLDPEHPRWIGSILSETPSTQAELVQRLYAIKVDNDPPDGLQMYDVLLDNGAQKVFTLTGGSDGAPPKHEYETALELLAGIEDISIIAAPGSSALEEGAAKHVRGAVITSIEKQKRRYRIAVLDTPPKYEPGNAAEWRAEIDSKYAALYYPWVVVSNPLARAGDERTPKEIALPPSGFICGIYARNDVERGVFKAPANEVVRSALRFEKDIDFGNQERLNPLGVNCLRFFPGRGYRVWGARTASSDSEWKYVNIRRYFNFLERSIDVGTQWAVFEPNGERLWSNIRDTISSFLDTQWRSGALLGTDTKQAFFVRCDRSTMTQDDLDNGRLICLVGVAVVKPAEFVIFRIGQKTADARS
jgi:hypothetical protein